MESPLTNLDCHTRAERKSPEPNAHGRRALAYVGPLYDAASETTELDKKGERDNLSSDRQEGHNNPDTSTHEAREHAYVSSLRETASRSTEPSDWKRDTQSDTSHHTSSDETLSWPSNPEISNCYRSGSSPPTSLHGRRRGSLMA